MIDSSTYVCTVCRETFNKGRSDEEAADEYVEMFPGAPPIGSGENIIVCDDCWECLRPDLDLAALERWRGELRALPVGTPVMVKFVGEDPVLRRGFIWQNDDEGTTVALKLWIVGTTVLISGDQLADFPLYPLRTYE
jgi:hypothetical protein